MIAMISGHLDLTEEEFKEHYDDLIYAAVLARDGIVIGDAPGADTMAQRTLSAWGYPYVTIYYNAQWAGPRNNIGAWKTIAVGMKPYEKDAAMTAASDYDIAWVRPGKEKSGTAANLKRRVKKAKIGDNENQ